MATLFLTTAGCGMLVARPLDAMLGAGFLPLLAEFFGATTFLLPALGAYAVATRRRLHPAHVGGAA